MPDVSAGAGAAAGHPLDVPASAARVGDLLVFYGSLLRGLGLPGEPAREPGLTFVAPCRIPGELYVVGDGGYPALRLPADGAAPGAEVQGEVWQIDDLEALARFDDWELAGHGPGTPEVPYERLLVRMVEPDALAWTYVGRHRERGPVVPSGDWRVHLRGQSR